MTILKNELHLLTDMMPLWAKYADGFVFMDDDSDDGSYEFLQENKEKYNIISILKTNKNKNELSIESDIRQKLFDEAFKYSGNILCLDADEYLDGELTKKELKFILEQNKDTLIHLQWIQYVDKNKIRIDGPWGRNFKDRLGSYTKRAIFKNAQMHSEHMPRPGKEGIINFPKLFISHLQWLDKDTVGVKQYFWKITDYVNRVKFGIETVPASAYDSSVNNFQWNCIDFPFDLKVDKNIFKKQKMEESYKYKFIKENIKKYNIPNLNDWGMNIHE
jgi:hypothetical protein